MGFTFAHTFANLWLGRKPKVRVVTSSVPNKQQVRRKKGMGGGFLKIQSDIVLENV
jgi:hypothetical protein